MLMKNEQPSEQANGEFNLTAQELQLALNAIGDRADALLQKAGRSENNDLMDQAWDHINLYNKICARTSVQVLRTTPKPRSQRRTSQRACSRFS
jgi:hypothetical protein